MKSKNKTENFFRQRLMAYLHERHPERENDKHFIESRSANALKKYWDSIHRGHCQTVSISEADSVLFEGLVFSRFYTLHCILQTEFSGLPSAKQRECALKLEPYCNDIFERYDLDDGITERSEYNHLIVDLIEQCKRFFADHPEYNLLESNHSDGGTTPPER